ncbi:MAG: hypothetical protein JSR44_15210 [Spirochaetes bacterium]|nr:hypothetical protein [Spirochaetota bacterium]
MRVRFIESICLKDGALRNLSLHQRRLDLTQLAHFGALSRIYLAEKLATQLMPQTGLHKIRVTYEKEIQQVEIEPYTQRAIEGITLINADALDYRYKYAERSALEALLVNVLSGVQPILVKQDYITDALFANVCFFDGVRWLTPASPLLEGTARAAALAAGEVATARIRAEDVAAGIYNSVKFINCMAVFAEAPAIPCRLPISSQAAIAIP